MEQFTEKLVTDHPSDHPVGHALAYSVRRPEANDPIRDWRGQPLNKGDRVVYSTRFASSMNYVEGTIVDILDNGKLRIQPHFEGTHSYKRDVRGGKNRTVSLEYITKVEA